MAAAGVGTTGTEAIADDAGAEEEAKAATEETEATEEREEMEDWASATGQMVV